MSDYPRSLYMHGWSDLSAHRIVRSAEEEVVARAEGWKTLTEFPHPDVPVPVSVAPLEPEIDPSPTADAPPADPPADAPKRKPGRPRKAQ